MIMSEIKNNKILITESFIRETFLILCLVIYTLTHVRTETHLSGKIIN